MQPTLEGRESAVLEIIDTKEFNDKFKRSIFREVMKGNWDAVVELYGAASSFARKVKITRWGDTVMHVAVMDRLTEKVKQLVEKVPRDEVTEILKIGNERGNTPLHLAAAQGNKALCECFLESVAGGDVWVEIDPGGEVRCDRNVVQLIGARNKDGETPIILAALHGEIYTFSLLYSVIKSRRDKLSFCRTKDGRNILHYAISGEHFELAVKIVKMYPELVNYRDEQGKTGLRVLAYHPSAFKSTTQLSRLQKIIYICISIDPVDEMDVDEPQRTIESNYIFPKNCRTCYDCFMLVVKVFRIPVGNCKRWAKRLKCCDVDTKNPTDTENPPESPLGSHEVPEDNIGPSGQKINLPDTSNSPTSKSAADAKNPSEIVPDKNLDSGGSDGKIPDNGGPSDHNIQLLMRSNSSTDVGRNGRPARQDSQGANQSSILNQVVPPNYVVCHDLFYVFMKLLLVFFGFGAAIIENVRDIKMKHVWALQLLDILVEQMAEYDYDDNGTNPGKEDPGDETPLPSSPPKEENTGPLPLGPLKEGDPYPSQLSNPSEKEAGVKDGPNTDKKSDEKGEGGNEKSKQEDQELPKGASKDKLVQGIESKLKCAFQLINELVERLSGDEANEKKKTEQGMKETSILNAAKMGEIEIVEKILDTFPVAIQDIDHDHKNIVLLAAENRQPKVIESIQKRNILKENVFQVVDRNGNNALHLAAKLGDVRPWLIPGAALQMQWEIKWFKFVKDSMQDSMPANFVTSHNDNGKTPQDIFTEEHEKMVKAGGDWLTTTSQSCSVVAALIATVAFATAATVPGGVNQSTGIPTLEGKPAFDVFSIASLAALGFSISSLALFLSILTSRYQQSDFEFELPMKLILGLSSLFISIASMLVSFCGGHFFVLQHKLKNVAYPIYIVTCLPVTLFALAQIPLYIDLIRATFTKVPRRSYEELPM